MKSGPRHCHTHREMGFVSGGLGELAGKSRMWGYGKPRMNNAQAAARVVWESLPAKPEVPTPDQVRTWAQRFSKPRV